MTQPSGDIWPIHYHYTNVHCIWGICHNCHQTRQALCQNLQKLNLKGTLQANIYTMNTVYVLNFVIFL